MRRIRRVIIGVLCFMLLVPVQVLASDNKPETWGNVDIDDNAVIPDCEAGKAVKVILPLVNLGTTTVTQVRVIPIRSADPAVYPFTTNKTNEYIKYNDIAPGTSENGEMEFTVRQNVLSKDYTLKFIVEYYDTGKKVELTKEVFIQAKGIEAKPSETPKPTDKPAEPVEPAEPSDGGGYDGGGSIGGGGGDAPSGGEATEKKTGKPRVIIEGFRTEPKVVNAGASFKLILEVRNTSKKTAVSNMEINLQAASASDSSPGAEGGGGMESSDVFLPDKGSNTLYVDSIAANSTKEVSVELTARADLQQRPYAMGIGMKYEDNKAEEHEATANISIPIKQEARFELSKVEVMPESIEVGSEGNVVFSIYNLGRTKLYNVQVELIGDSVAGGEAFVGNLEAGATGEVDLMVTGVAETTDDGTVKIQVSYEDQDGNANSFEGSCTIFVMQMMDEGDMIIDDGMMELEEGSSGLSTAAKAGIGVGVLAVVGLGTFAIIKHKRKKEEDFADEFLGSDKDERK